MERVNHSKCKTEALEEKKSTKKNAPLTPKDILIRVDIHAPPSTIYEMINSRAGLERWFSDDVQKHDCKTEGKIILGIYRYRCIYDITKLVPFSYIEWFCFDPTDCVQFNTKISFKMESLGEGNISLVEFEHTGWNSTNMSYFDNYDKGWKDMINKLKMACENPEFRSPWSFKTPLCIEISTEQI